MANTWTETDLQNIKSAIMDLASGKRVVQVSIEGDLTRYGEADLPALMSLYEKALSQYQAENSTAGDYFLTRTKKGL